MVRNLLTNPYAKLGQTLFRHQGKRSRCLLYIEGTGRPLCQVKKLNRGVSLSKFKLELW
jgi:hypothetical protein